MESSRLLKIRIEPDEEGQYIPGVENISGMYLLIEKNDIEPNNTYEDRFGLTPCEAKVMELVARGLEDKQIADILCKSVWTVRNQNKTIFGKMGVGNRTEAGVMWRNERGKDGFRA